MNRIETFTSTPLSRVIGFSEDYPLYFNSRLLGGFCLLRTVSLYGITGPIGAESYEIALCDGQGNELKRVGLAQDGNGYGNASYYQRWTADFGGLELVPDTGYKLIPFADGSPATLQLQQGTGKRDNPDALHGVAEILDTLYPVGCEMTAKRIAWQDYGFVHDLSQASPLVQNEYYGPLTFDTGAIFPGLDRVNLKHITFALAYQEPLDPSITYYDGTTNHVAQLVKLDTLNEYGCTLYKATFDEPIPVSGVISINPSGFKPAYVMTMGTEVPDEGMPSMGLGINARQYAPAVEIGCEAILVEDDPVYERSKETFSTLAGSTAIKQPQSDGRIRFDGSIFKGRNPRLREVLLKTYEDSYYPSSYNRLSVYVGGRKVATSPVVDYGSVKSAVFNGDIQIADQTVYLALENWDGSAPVSLVSAAILTTPEGDDLPSMVGTSDHPAIEICVDAVTAGSEGTTILDVRDLSAMGAINLKQTQRSFAAGTVSFMLPVDRPDQAPKLYDRERVRIIDGNHVLIEGTAKINTTLSGGIYYDNVTISDDWSLFAVTPYLSYGTIRGRVGYSYQTSRSTSTDNQTVAINAAFAQVLDYAGVDYELRISDGAEMIPFTASANKIGTLLENIRQWRPGLVSWWDYSQGNKLIISDQIRLEHREFDLSGREHSECEINARPDLSPPVVAVYFEDRTGDGGTYYSVTKYPEDEPVNQPYAYTVAGPGAESSYVDDNGDPVEASQPYWSMNLDKIVVKGRTIQHSDAGIMEFVFRKIPVLKDYQDDILPVAGSGSVKGLDYDGLESEKPDNYDKQATNMELIDGSLSKKCGIKYCNSEVKVTLLLRAGVTVPDEIKSYFPDRDASGNFKGYFAYTVTTINRGGTYIIGGSVDDYPGDNAEPTETTSRGDVVNKGVNKRIPSLVRDYYEVTRLLQYEGELVTVDRDYEIRVGSTLSLTGGREEWKGMKTLVQSVTRDIGTGKTTVEIGAHNYLSLEDAINKADLTSQIEESEQNEQDKPEPADPQAVQYQWDNRREFPNVSPSCVGGVTGAASGGTNHPYLVKISKNDSGVWKGHVQKGYFTSEAGKNVEVDKLEQELTLIDAECMICLDWEYTVLDGARDAMISVKDTVDGTLTVVTPITGEQSIGASRVALAKISAIKDDGSRSIDQYVTTHLRAHWIPNHKEDGSDTISAAQDATAGRGAAS